MDSYIVRVYRRDKPGNSPVRGLVEKVGAVGQDVFGTKEELWNILSIVKKPGRRKKNSGRSGITEQEAGQYGAKLNQETKGGYNDEII